MQVQLKEEVTRLRRSISGFRVVGICNARDARALTTPDMICIKKVITASSRGLGMKNFKIENSNALKSRVRYYCSSNTNIHIETQLMKQLKAKIKLTGPITVADYMKEVLTNPTAGYYTTSGDVLGRGGDFITSPEISQMFGELIAVWCIHEWFKLGSPNPFHLVEFGPGRGTLMDDICRVFSRFAEIQKVTSIHLVEISPKLQELQEIKLCGSSNVASRLTDKCQNETTFYQQNVNKYGMPVYWYKDLAEVPQSFSCFIAHEFFDALPIHKFQKVSNVWHEILIDTDHKNPSCLRYVLSRGPTPASKILIPDGETRDHLEISAEGGILANSLANRIEMDGGFVLIVDYGHSGTKTDTFRAFRNHKLHDPLCEPGTADLTADVDFSYLVKSTKNKTLTFGPVNQGTFLKNMEIQTRLEKLLASGTANCEELVLGYNKLVSPSEMGTRFKVLSLFPAVLKEYQPNFSPVGF